MTGRIERAGQLYEQAVFGGDPAALAEAERELDTAEADLALARGRVLHARFLERREEDPRELPLFEQAARRYRRLGDEPGEAEALFWIGCFHQVVRDDHDTARPALTRAHELGDDLTRSYAARHLGFAAAAAGDTATARARLEESVRLRRNIGFDAGVAAGLVALAQVADRAEAQALLSEAEALALGCQAHGVLRWIEQARHDLA